jgi:hypothetical protein
MRQEALLYAQLPLALRSYMRAPRSSNAAAQVSAQLANRGARFLDLLRRTIFADPTHPYHRMFQSAGCAFGDLANAVQRDGLEPALSALRREGVYLAHDEFKGRAPIVRSGRHFPASAASWDNPLVSGGLPGRSSGSSGASVSTNSNIPFLCYQDAHLELVWREFEFAQRPHVELRSILPSLRAFEQSLAAARLGYRIDRWFSPGKPSRYATLYAAATNLMVATVNLSGARMPFPEVLPPHDFLPVAAWVAGQRANGVSCALTGFVSPAVRIASTAVAHSLDIRGTIFVAGGEALTPAKRAVIDSAGAEIYPRYHITEIGDIGHACRQMRTGNSVHLYRDAVAAIVHKRPARLSSFEVDSLLFTTLLPASPRILINVEMEDSGVLAESACDCAFTRAGLTTVIRDIASFGKLTGHGVTLVGTDLVSVLEQRLPALLGGTVGDYQLVEREAAGETQIVLFVSPRVPTSADAARRCFLQELERQFGGSLAVGLWTHTHAMQAIIHEPIAGATGKVLPLHLLGLRKPATG